ncbi:energy transducer TonB [Oleidesulfovibrio sp.]|uniref:energy transducer TonB n=1 Tax=Oleidesulfovibrio sp. TaxID=2909707 RepID=UPI003A88B47B
MKKAGTVVLAAFGGIGVTVFLLLFLLAGTSPRRAVEKPVLHGAVKLSSFRDAPVQEEQTFATQDVQQVQPLEHVAQLEMSMDSPALEMDMPSMEMDFAPEVAGTAPVSGVPSMAAAGGLSSPSGGALTLGEVDEQPRPLYTPAPLYPIKAKRLGTECTVTLRILLREDGTVGKATPVDPQSGKEAFYEAAKETVMQWRFVPCKVDGKAVQCIADQPFSFSLSR